ncbi:MAG: hypothetical protein Q7I97_04910 [Thermovirgaceae bacterium]|nr:hypothetical protein [Thermovirgaceae bacterium]
MVFHYSGSWGSRRAYSFSQNYSDLHAVRSAIADEAFAETFGLFSGGLNPLNGATAESLMSDIMEKRKK